MVHDAQGGKGASKEAKAEAIVAGAREAVQTAEAKVAGLVAVAMVVLPKTSRKVVSQVE